MDSDIQSIFNLSIIARMRTENIYMKTSLLCGSVFCWITFSKKVIHRWLKWTPIKVTIVVLKFKFFSLFVFFMTVLYIRRYLWMVTKTNYLISSLISISWTIYKLILLKFSCEKMASEVWNCSLPSQQPLRSKAWIGAGFSLFQAPIDSGGNGSKKTRKTASR